MNKNSQDSEINEKLYEEMINVISSQKKQVASLASPDARLIAVSKQQPPEKVLAMLSLGQRVFGENRFQDAKERWEPLKPLYSDLILAFIGGLQSNKAAEVVAFFDEIHSVDRKKIADVLAKEMQLQGRRLPCYIQVNTGEELQKSGVSPQEAPKFIQYCRDELKLPVVGLMCIPPVEQNPAPHFALLYKIAQAHHLPRLSMGMSDDWQTALRLGATDIRVGSALFGAR